MSSGDQLSYRAKPGSQIRRADVEPIGRELAALAAGERGMVPALVVEAARAETSAMHAYFEWDDTKAAQAARLDTASKLIRSIEVKVLVAAGGHPVTAYSRKFFSVQLDPPAEADPAAETSAPAAPAVTEKRYLALEVVARNPDYMGQVLANAERELYGWRERVRLYQHLEAFSRFAAVLAAIDRLREERPAAAAD